MSQTHAGYRPKEWAERYALVAGGEAFSKLVARFLPRNPFEPLELWQERCEVAKDSYEPHLQNIIRATEGDLFAQPLAIRAKGKDESALDSFWADFKENCDGKGLDLSNFMRAQFVEALIYGSAGWLCELPSDASAVKPETEAQAKDLRSVQRATLSPVAIHDLWDCGYDDVGGLVFVVIHTSNQVRGGFLGKAKTVETWKVYTATEVGTYQIQYERMPNPEDPVSFLGSVKHGFNQIPYVSLILPSQLAIMDAAAPLARKHFRLGFSLEWALARTSYPIPIYRTKEDPEKVASGFGHAIKMGIEDHFDWVVPPSEGFEVQSKLIDSTREQLYRVTGATFLADKNNTASSERRSGVSKDADHARWETQLNGFGALLKQSIEDTYCMIADARREDNEWDITGLTIASLQQKAVSLDELLLALEKNLSETANVELKVSIVDKVLPMVGQDIRSKIRAEVESAKGETVGPESLAQAKQSNPLHSGAEQAPSNERDAR